MTDWTEDAACLGMSVDIFHPEEGSRRSDPGAFNAYRRALRTCARCPVRRPCLEAVLRYEEPRWVVRKVLGAQEAKERGWWTAPLPNGVYGGTMPYERHLAAIVHTSTHDRKGKQVCDIPRCHGCRPIAERVDILEDLFNQTARKRGLVTDKERVA